MADPISSLGLTCPEGGGFYICQGNSTQFLGCCASDPCADGRGSCPQDDLRSSSFNSSQYDNIASQACAGTSGSWYTCSKLDTPFLGCCESNACNSNGCPADELVAAQLSDDEGSAASFKTQTAALSTVVETSSTTISITISATGTTTSSSTATATATASSPPAAAAAADDDGPSGLSAGAKAGISVGGAVALIALIALLLVVARRIMKNRGGVVVRGSEPPTPSNAAMSGYPTSSYLHYDPNRILHTPDPDYPEHAEYMPTSAQPLASNFHNNPPKTSSESWRSPSAAVSRQASVSSSSSCAVGLGIDPSSPLQDTPHHRQSYHPYAAQQYQPQALETVMELDGASTVRPDSRTLGSSPEVSPIQQPTRCYPPAVYRPYRPSMQDFHNTNSGLYP